MNAANGPSRTALSLSGQVALVTGAARGLGRSEALALAERGASVAVVDLLDASATVNEIREAGGAAIAVRANVACRGAADDVLTATLEAFGDLDILVNNAGLVRDRMSFNLSDEDWELVVAVNLSATFFLARAAARYWRERGRSGDDHGAAIVNTSSESGLYGNVGQANYAAAKAGVAGLTLTLAAELNRYGIRVNAIAPRARTPMSDAAFGELPRDSGFDPFGPEHVAAVVAWLVSGAARDVSGQVLVVHGAEVEVLQPWSSVRRLTRRGPWTDRELEGLASELFPDGRSRRLSEPVGRLFVHR